MLSSIDITNWLSHDSAFVGVFPINTLPVVNTNYQELKFVVNTDANNLPGQH